MSDIDPNKIINLFEDCKGTCKTPIGCTCGRREPKDVAPSSAAKSETPNFDKIVAILPEILEKTQSVLHRPKNKRVRLCSCGNSETGICGCASKSNAKKGACCTGTNKLEVSNWLDDMPPMYMEANMVEVQFKNTRKGYYVNSNNLELFKGDVVAVEAVPGHDIGEVTLTGKLVELQMKKANFRGDVRRIYRHAKQSDIDKYEQVKLKEYPTMLRAREIAEALQLDMKISDVEYQGDGNKAIFYYIANGRVDFRQLIKLYASEFHVKIEMKQIGARQEAGRVGGIGPCGRELCCSSSMSNFVSVSTSAARLQDIPLNPQKLAGQCGKLKCCLNFEVDTYVEARKKLPSKDTILETKDASYYHFKTDVLSGEMIYSTDKHFAANLITLDKERVFEVIRMNRRGEKPLVLNEQVDIVDEVEAFNKSDVLEQESITRFDNNDNNRRNNKRKPVRKNNGGDDNGNNRPERRRNNTRDSFARNDREEANEVNNSPNEGNRGPKKRPILNKNVDREAKPEVDRPIENTQVDGEQLDGKRRNPRYNNRNNRFKKNNNRNNKPRPE